MTNNYSEELNKAIELFLANSDLNNRQRIELSNIISKSFLEGAVSEVKKKISSKTNDLYYTPPEKKEKNKSSDNQ